MKLFSDLRLNNTQVTEQFTALILAGVAAVVIGGVAHMGSHRSSGFMTAQAPFTGMAMDDEFSNSQPILRSAAPVMASAKAAVERDTAPAVLQAQDLTPLVMAPIVSPIISQAVAALDQVAGRRDPIVRTAEIGRNQSLSTLLVTEADLDNAEVAAISKAIAEVYKGKYARGLEISLRFTRTGDEEAFGGLTFQPEATTEIRVNRMAGDVYKAERITTPLERQRNAVEGEIQTSLIEAGAKYDIPRNVMSSMVRAFSHEIDFQRDIHPGDKFRVLYDQPRAKNGQAVGDATIIYAAIESRGAMKAVYRVIYSDGTAEYYNDRGESVRRGLMRTPVDGAHMSSNYGMRRHPILGYSKFHQGVDFSAPSGTPIFAAGDGIVKEAGFRSGYGRFVRLQHRSGLETAYAHMSRFARGLNVGDKVSQGDVIAYVGATGRATGPHLHFEVRVNGQAVNPMNVNMQAGNKLTGKSMAQFKVGKVTIEAEFKRRAVAALEDGARVKLAAGSHEAAAE